jgi:hypothetical protein
MSNFLVETKQEYTTQLTNVLTPLVYEGLQSIYNEVIKISTSDNVLKHFQIAMQRIPKWNNEIIQNETERIMNNSKSYSWLEDLIKATLKANIIVLTYNPSTTQQIKVDPQLYQNIKITDFIHKIYVECARELWNNPYLFYHNYPPIELKRNQRDCVSLIKDCVKEALRKLLPVKHILQIYLGEEMEVGLPDNNFDKSISEIEEKNLNKLIRKDLNLQSDKPLLIEDKSLLIEDKSNNNVQKILNNTSENNIIEPSKENIESKFNVDSVTINGINAKTQSTNDTVGAKILGIINNKDIKLTENRTSSEELPVNNIDPKIKRILEKDLNESETSVSNNPNDKFQEVFSNSIQKEVVVNEKNNKDKAKFFANYLNI